MRQLTFFIRTDHLRAHDSRISTGKWIFEKLVPTLFQKVHIPRR